MNVDPPASAREREVFGQGYQLGATAGEQMEEALIIAHEFIEKVTAWQGHEDDHAEALQACDDALAARAA